MKPITKKYIIAGVGLTITGLVIYFAYKYIDRKITEKKLRDAKIKSDKDAPVDPNIINPNEIPQMIGKTVYPKIYVNVRSENYVDNRWPNNFIGKVDAPNPVGKVLDVTINGEGATWYKIAPITANLKDDKTLGSANKKATTGYVRSDNVTLK
jgi:hypothetical protein